MMLVSEVSAMAIKKFFKKIALAIGLINMSLSCCPNIAFAEIIEQTVEATGVYRMGDNETRQQAQEMALANAKRIAAEKVMVFLDSSTDVKNFELQKDEIKTYTSARMQILEQTPTWDAQNITCSVSIVARVKIDTEALKNIGSSPSSQGGNTTVSMLNDKEVRAEGEYQMGGNDTMEQAKSLALKNAITNASMTAGIQVRNFTKVNNFVVSDDVIETYTQSKVRVKSQEWKNEGFLFKVTIIAEVDLDETAMREYFERLTPKPAPTVTVAPPVVTQPPVVTTPPVTVTPPITTPPVTIPSTPPVVTTPQPSGAIAPAGDKQEYKGHHYQIFDGGLEWDAAKSYCEGQGGHLVTIGSKGEQEFIESMLKNQGQRNSYWIGGTRSMSGRVSWIDGTPFNYTNWAKGQPDNPRERALMIYKNANPKAPAHVLGTWNDLSSDGTFPGETFFGLNNFGFICEWDS